MTGSIEAAIFARLKAQLPAGIDVYLNEIPEEEHGSCVVMETALRRESEGTAPVYTAEVRTAAYAKAYGANQTLAGQVRAALDGWMYGAAGVRLGPLQLVDADPGYEVLWDQHRLTLTWNGYAVLWTV